MRYIDSASGLPADSLAAWLLSIDPKQVTAMRLQSGFFSADALPYLSPILADLAARGALVNIVIGSNQGATQLEHVRRLLDTAGADRDGLQIGVVRFSHAFFHPKTMHVQYAGSAEAYVGSSNFTMAGIGALHVEAGLLISSTDDSAVVASIASAIDAWFVGVRPEFTPIDRSIDLRALVARNVLRDAPLPSTAAGDRSSGESGFISRRPLLYPPHVSRPASLDMPEGGIRVSISPPVGALSWSKSITATDAQRKASGNQSGAISLVRAGHPIVPQTWFRDDLFSTLAWVNEPTRTARVKEVATAPMRVRVLGVDRGGQLFRISHDPLRASGQGNYATLLHLGPLSDTFHTVNLTGRTLNLARDSMGKLSLTIF